MPRLLSTLILAIFALPLVASEPLPWDSFVSNYCLDCHDADSMKGGLDLELALDSAFGKEQATWENVVRQLRGRQMPPSGKRRPSEPEYTEALSILESRLDAFALENPNPGRTDTMRRLNRNEYQNAIRDLLHVEIDATKLLPPDQSSHGFDNITVADLPPALLERYISAAQKVSRAAMGGTGNSVDGRTVRVPPDFTQESHVEGLPFGTRGGTLIRHSFPQDGEYDIRVHLMRDRNEEVEGLTGTHELQVLLDDHLVESFQIKPPRNPRDHTKVDAHLAACISVQAGVRNLGVTFVQQLPRISENLRQPYESAFNRHRHPRRSPAVYQISITGPFNAKGPGQTVSRARVFGDVTARDATGARAILNDLMRRAYRGFQTEEDLKRAMAFYLEGESNGGFEAGTESALAAILVSPKFLFRIERDPEDSTPNTPYRLTARELASRLSFFLWSSLPDDELLDAAKRGDLDTPVGLANQAQRMLKDPKSQSLVDHFAGQWLYLRNLDSITPDGRLYPDFDDNLRQAMREETKLLFNDMVQNDRSILNLLSSNHTFLNERLAKHYGVPHIYGNRFRRVSLPPDSDRGGILRHASILTVTSYANRTSPVLRGHWLLENLLGTPPPPPPPDVPTLEDNTVDASLPIRERLAVHRENAACAQCHDVMDPLGFAFENYDAIGQWRTLDGGMPVDSQGTMPDGTTFTSINGLEQGILARPELFARTLTEKLLTFGLGRGVEPSDASAVRKIVKTAADDNFQFSAIIQGIVTSDPFTMRMTNP